MAISLYELSQRIAASVPVGTIVAYYGSSAPSGWLICDGRSCAGTPLANMIGNYVPDLRGRFIRMIGGNAAGMGVAQDMMIQSHEHKLYQGDGSGGHSIVADYLQQRSGWNQWRCLTATGGVETRPVNMAFNYIIRAIA